MPEREQEPTPEINEEKPLTLSSTPQKAMDRYLEYRKHRFPEDESIEKAAWEITDELEKAKGERTELLTSGERTNMMRHFNINSPVPMSHKSVLIQALIAHIKKESLKLPEKKNAPVETSAEAAHKDGGPFTSLDHLAKRHEEVGKDFDSRNRTQKMAEWLKFQSLDLSKEEQKKVSQNLNAHTIDTANPQSNEFYLSVFLSNRITAERKKQDLLEKPEPTPRKPKIISPEKSRIQHKYNTFITHLKDRVIDDLKGDLEDIDPTDKIASSLENQDLSIIDSELEEYISHFSPENGTTIDKLSLRLMLIFGKELREEKTKEKEKPKGLWGKFKGLFG